MYREGQVGRGITLRYRYHGFLPSDFTDALCKNARFRYGGVQHPVRLSATFNTGR